MQQPTAKPEDAEELMRQIIEPVLRGDGYVFHGFDTSSYPSVASIFRRQPGSDAQPTEIAVEYKFSRDEFVGFQAASSVRRVALSAGIPRSILITNARFTPHALDVFRLTDPIAFEPIDVDGLRLRVEKIYPDAPHELDPISIIARDASQKYIAAIVADPSSLDRIEWRDMERLLAEVFEGLGFGVRLGRGSGDGGKDITLTCLAASGTHTYYVEVKHWRSPVGPTPIRNFLNVIVKEEVDGGLFLSSGGLSKRTAARLTEIRREFPPLRIGNGSKINALCQSYVRMASGIWTPELSLQELLFDTTI